MKDRTLTPQERQRLEHERRTSLSSQYRAELNEFHDEELALASDPNAARTASGKTIRRHHRTYRDDSCSQSEKAAMAAAFESITLSDLRRIWDQMNYLQASFGLQIPLASTAAPAAVPIEIAKKHSFEDGERIFDTEMVSSATAKTIYDETAIVAERISELEAIKDPALHRQKALELVELVHEYDMIQHPRTGLYIHSILRVEELESINNAAGENCLAEVCVFRSKLDIASSRGVKRSISDVYNNNPEEVELTQSEKTPDAPHYRHS